MWRWYVSLMEVEWTLIFHINLLYISNSNGKYYAGHKIQVIKFNKSIVWFSYQPFHINFVTRNKV